MDHSEYGKLKVKRKRGDCDAANSMKISNARDTEARSCNHSCSRKAIGITYSECVSVA